ncbi:hypothetical protein [Endozoicomonas numazuensis]|uniref:Uncharacterized protein n=1 Tax=Endozoicomonas numazuensis TaxID=1137799 RepID=A0A081NF36_9GAMM|nr:hypothetical protein [Endozoicomonas numazuensis]KEQ17059.1 hypothetical protein GZ78_14280 [Endozoicomonas numazuensis]
MKISNTLAPLLVSAVRDAIIYQEGFLGSDTVKDTTDYEEHIMQLEQLLEILKEEYKEIEEEVGLPLDKILK